MDEFQVKLRPNPEKDANFFSRIFFCFIWSFIREGYRRPLDTVDLYEVLPADESSHLCEKLESAWKTEVARAKTQNRKPQLKRAVLSVFWKRYAVAGVITFMAELTKLLQVVLMDQLINFFQADGNVSKAEAYGYACGLTLCALALAVMHHPYFYHLQRIGAQIRISCSALVFKKSVLLRTTSLRKVTIGKIINLLSNDAGRFDHTILFLHYLWVTPLSLLGFTVVLWYIMGPACLAGMFCLILLIPVQGKLGEAIGKRRREVAELADKRIGIMSEILNGIRVIKMYAWERPFAKLVDNARTAEMKTLRIQAVLQAIVMALYFTSGKLVMLPAIVAYVLLAGHEVDAGVVFVASALFNSARTASTKFLPNAIQCLAETRVTFNRLDEFLLLEEKGPPALPEPRPTSKSSNGKVKESKPSPSPSPSVSPSPSPSPSTVIQSLKSEKPCVEMIDYCAKWDEDQPTLTLNKVNLSIKPGQLVIVVGPVGAGKSSILMSLLGEIIHVSGQMRVEGSVAYVPQESWIFSASLRRNVTFGTTDLDVARYKKVLSVCSLRKDIESMKHKDITLIGDKGVGLSGGQKARVNLARAVYNDADVFLLDDPLSAVDSVVGRNIFEKCILGYLRQKTRILVTHQLQYLRKADHILVVKGGKIVASGTFKELYNLGEDFTSILGECEDSYKQRDSTSLSGKLDVERLFDRSDEKIKKEEVESAWSIAKGEIPPPPKEEDRSTGAVSYRVYYEYFSAMDNCGVACLLLLFCLFVQALFNFSDYWLKIWTQKTEYEELIHLNNTGGRHRKSHAGNLTAPTFFIAEIGRLTSEECLIVYSVLIIALVVCSLARATLFRYLLTRSSLALHSRMFRAVLQTPIIFFDRNPIGRILNRFSRDTGIMDEHLGYVTFDFTEGMIIFIGIIVVVCLIHTWLLIPTLVLLAVFMGLRHYYMQTARSVKRMESTTKSPIFSHVASTLDGLTTIRAFSASPSVLNDFHHYQNIHSAAFSAFLSMNRWFALTIDTLCAAYIGVVAFGSTMMSVDTPTSSSAVGLALAYAMALMNFFQWVVRQSTEMESMMVSVERILEYTRLPPEPGLAAVTKRKRDQATEVPRNWPEKGEIKFDHVSMKYAPDEPDVLHDVSLVIKPAEKIGIVGRTGAGKSSLLNVMFRLSEPSGVISIDGRDTKTIDLHELRKRLSIIPQNPVLFIGTLRENLDPFDEFTDSDIWTALAQVELKATVDELPKGLATSMQEGGGNLSIGQRQLVCLARAILRHNKILFIDEATANVDLHTDAMIQRTLRQTFKDCTVLTIAHRLHTIMDSTRVMVLDQGRVIEFDSPALLLRNGESAFGMLVQRTGKANAEKLIKAAEDAYAKQMEEDSGEKKVKS